MAGTYLREPWKRRPTLPGTRVSRGCASWGHTFLALFNNHYPSSSIATKRPKPLNSLFQHGLHLFLRLDERSYESESIGTATPHPPDQGERAATFGDERPRCGNLLFTFKNARKGYTLEIGVRPSLMKVWDPCTLFAKACIFREEWKQNNKKIYIYLNSSIFQVYKILTLEIFFIYFSTRFRKVDVPTFC